MFHIWHNRSMSPWSRTTCQVWRDRHRLVIGAGASSSAAVWAETKGPKDQRHGLIAPHKPWSCTEFSHIWDKENGDVYHTWRMELMMELYPDCPRGTMFVMKSLVSPCNGWMMLVSSRSYWHIRHRWGIGGSTWSRCRHGGLAWAPRFTQGGHFHSALGDNLRIGNLLMYSISCSIILQLFRWFCNYLRVGNLLARVAVHNDDLARSCK